MTINDFSMTKDQYDHICYLIATSPRVDQDAIDYGIKPADPEKVQRRSAIIYIIKLSTVESKVINGRFIPGYRINTISECIEIAKKIQSKLGYKS